MGESYKDLIVWQRGIELCLEIYRLTADFPAAERFGLTVQLRRAAVSIASNIAEGYGRATTGEYRLFLGHARGSNCELQTQLILARKLSFAPEAAFDQAESLSADISRLLIAIMKNLP